MRQYNSDNKKLFGEYAQQLIETTTAGGKMLDYTVVRSGIDYLMEQGRYADAERCLYYNINNPSYTNNNVFSLACRGLLLCSVINRKTDNTAAYQEILNNLRIIDRELVIRGMETPLYQIHQYLIYIREESKKQWNEIPKVEKRLRSKFKGKFKNMADYLPSIPYYKIIFREFQYFFPELVLDILQEAVYYEKYDEELYIDAAKLFKSISKKESLKTAEKILNNVLDRNAYNDMAWYELGDLYNALGDYAKELNAYKKAEIINKSESLYPYKIAKAYYRKGNYASALEYFLKYDRFPDDNKIYVVHDNIGNCYMNIGQFEEAIEYYDKALESNGIINHYRINQTFVMKLMCLIKLGRAKEAEEEYSKVDVCNKEDIGLWSSLKAQILLALGKQDEAESYLMEMAKNNEFNAFTLTELIEFQLKHETYILARFYINMLLCYTKELHKALMYEAVVDYKCGDIDTAANNLNTAFKIDPLAKENFNSYCPEAKMDKNFQDMISELPF